MLVQTHLCNKCLILVHMCSLFTVVKHWISTSVFHIAFLIIYHKICKYIIIYVTVGSRITLITVPSVVLTVPLSILLPRSVLVRARKKATGFRVDAFTGSSKVKASEFYRIIDDLDIMAMVQNLTKKNYSILEYNYYD